MKTPTGSLVFIPGLRMRMMPRAAPSTGLTKFTRFETLYVILLNIHKTLPKQRCSSHFARPKEKKKYYIHFLALALTLTLSLTLTFNHLANEPIQPTIMLFSLMYLTCGNATEQKYLIRCATDYKWLLK